MTNLFHFLKLFVRLEKSRHLNFCVFIHSFSFDSRHKKYDSEKQKLDKLNIHTKNSPEAGHRPHNEYKIYELIISTEKERKNKYTDGAENANKIIRRK